MDPSTIHAPSDKNSHIHDIESLLNYLTVCIILLSAVARAPTGGGGCFDRGGETSPSPRPHPGTYRRDADVIIQIARRRRRRGMGPPAVGMTAPVVGPRLRNVAPVVCRGPGRSTAPGPCAHVGPWPVARLRRRWRTARAPPPQRRRAPLVAARRAPGGRRPAPPSGARRPAAAAPPES